MKIAKLKSIAVQTTSQGILDNYYLVADNYVFTNDEDVTNVEALEVFHSIKKIDYGVFRDSVMSNVVPDWANLSLIDRQKCVSHYKYPVNISQDEFNSYFTSSQHRQNWNSVVNSTRKKHRLPRLFAAFQLVSYTLTQTQTMIIYTVSKNLCYDYYYANLPHLLLWIQNQAYPQLGVDYTTNGFAQQSGYTVQLKNQLLDILVNGNYDYAMFSDN